MKSLQGACAAAAAVGVLLWAGQATAQRQATIITPSETNQDVYVSDVQAYDGVVSGRIVNRSPEPVRDVELLIDHEWLWNNERHPGEVSPGRADVFAVRGEIPPGGSMPFTYQGPPLPQRDDGRFETQVQVTEFIQVGTLAAVNPRDYQGGSYQYRPAPGTNAPSEDRTYAPPAGGAYEPPAGMPENERGMY